MIIIIMTTRIMIMSITCVRLFGTMRYMCCRSEYYFVGGYNPVAIAAFVLGVLPNIPGNCNLSSPHANKLNRMALMLPRVTASDR